jgi:DNA-binding NarL/FixJ family response regulator
MSDIRVLIVDDHPVVRRGLRDVLQDAVGIKVIGEAATGTEAIELIRSQEPDVALLDMKLPDISGVETIKRVKESGSSTRILGLSSYEDREFISELLNQGASGYLLKEEAPEYIVEAVRGVANGEQGWLSRKVAALLSQMLLMEEQGGSDLTPRELKVLSLLVEGQTNDQIGITLGISVKTVENHLHSIFRKMNVASRVEAAVRAVREGVV